MLGHTSRVRPGSLNPLVLYSHQTLDRQQSIGHSIIILSVTALQCLAEVVPGVNEGQSLGLSALGSRFSWN